jgi:hypothetical protein
MPNEVIILWRGARRECGGQEIPRVYNRHKHRRLHGIGRRTLRAFRIWEQSSDSWGCPSEEDSSDTRARLPRMPDGKFGWRQRWHYQEI